MQIDNFKELSLELDDDMMLSLRQFADDATFKFASPLAGWSVQAVDTNKLSLGSTINNVIREFECDPIILQIKPGCHVPWHKDLSPKRKCVINVPLYEYTDNYTFFIDHPDADTGKGFLGHIPYLVPYTYKKLTLLNVSGKHHCVFNCTNEPRFLFSIQFPTASYHQMLDYFDSLTSK